MKDKEIKEYVKADKKARTLWSKSYKVEDSNKSQKLRSKAKDYYAEKEARGLKLQNPQTKITNTEVKISNSFNKDKSVKVESNAKFSFFKKNK